MAGLEELRNLSATKMRLLKLLKEWKDLSDISSECGLRKQSLIPHLKFLNTFGLIEKKGRHYRTTKVGELFLEKFSEFARFLNVIGSCGKFLSEHDISPIPANLLNRVGMLYGAKIYSKKNPYEFLPEWLDIVKNSGRIQGLSSVYHPAFSHLFLELSAERDVKLILTEEVLRQKSLWDWSVDFSFMGW